MIEENKETGQNQPPTAEDEEYEKLKKRALKFGLPIPEPPKKKEKVSEQPAPKPIKVDPEFKKKVLLRQEKFGTFAPKNDNFVESKFENPLSEGNEIRPNAIHLYGVDYLNNDNILSYFGEYNARTIEWLNLSSCNVVFDNEEDAKAAFQNLAVQKEYDTEWRECIPVEVQNLRHMLQMRMATKLDVKDPEKKYWLSKGYEIYYERFKKKQKEEEWKKKRESRSTSGDDKREKVMNKKIAKVPRKQPGQNSTKWNNLIRKGIRVIEDSSEQKAAQPSSVTEQNPETIDLTKEEEKKVEAVENKEPEAAEVKGKESPDDYNLDL